jgi:hypothetical protein
VGSTVGQKKAVARPRRASKGVILASTVNEGYNAQNRDDSYWLHVAWDPLADAGEPVRIRNLAVRLDHAKREVFASRFLSLDRAINQPAR